MSRAFEALGQHVHAIATEARSEVASVRSTSTLLRAAGVQWKRAGGSPDADTFRRRGVLGLLEADVAVPVRAPPVLPSLELACSQPANVRLAPGKQRDADEYVLNDAARSSFLLRAESPRAERAAVPA